VTGRRIRVAVLSGGRSSEHEISLASGSAVMDALDRTRYDVVPLHIRRDGSWELPGERGSRAALVPGRERETFTALPERRGGTEVEPAGGGMGAIDVVIPVLHGPYGEDGTVQGMLEMAGIPYVGSGVLGAALTMDKEVAKHVLRGVGIAVAPSLTLHHGRDEPEPAAARAAAELGCPCFVKPARLGSSVGITKAHDEAELHEAIGRAFLYDPKILVERFVEGIEVEIGVLGNDEPIASLPGEIVPDAEWYDWGAKYEPGGMELIVPARIGEAPAARLSEAALRAFQVCDCAGMARIDFFVTPEERVVLNEINTIPGFTSTSVYAKLFEASGVPYPQLLDRLIELALERHERSRAYRH
jgi:D-alanine-D-alanine ligase